MKIFARIYILAQMIVLLLAFTACSDGNLKDVSKEPEYQSVSNMLFITDQPLYYYKYETTQGMKTDHFLSSDPDITDAEMVEEIPESSHIKISKVYEFTRENEEKGILITGTIFSDPKAGGVEYEHIMDKENPIFKAPDALLNKINF